MGQVMDGARGEDEDEKKLALLDDDEEDPFATRPATAALRNLSYHNGVTQHGHAAGG